MNTCLPIVVITLSVFLREARPLDCYVCTKCPVDPKSDQSVKIEKDCSACVIEDKFNYKTYLQTDRSCGECPNKSLEMTNNDKSYYHCCGEALCLGVTRKALLEEAHPENTGTKHKTTAVKKVPTEREENQDSRGVVEVPSERPHAETDTGSSSTATDQSMVSKAASPKQSSDTAITPTETITAASTVAAKPKETIPESRRAVDVQSSTSSAETETQDSKISSTINDRTSTSNTASMQPSDDPSTSTATNKAKSATLLKAEESHPELPGKTDEFSVRTTNDTGKQDVESSSTPSCHTSVWYLAFSTFIICGHVARVN